MSNINRKKRKVSCLGVLLIACMVVIAGVTVGVNLLFRGSNAPEILGRRYCYYTAGEMGDRIPAGDMVIAEKADHIHTQDIVLYQSISGEYRIAVASLIVETQSNVPDQSGAVYYLTTVANTTAVEIPAERIAGICKQRSPQLGAAVGFLISVAGICAGLVLPCIILALYLIAVIISSREAKEELIDDEQPDLAFVKSIQKKQQEIAERDAERIAQQQPSIFDTPANSTMRRMTDEELARQEEEEAARRAERIAAVRSHMEQRRQTETPDGVPLYTTEVITKTHTMPIPKVNAQPAPQPVPTPTPAEDIPRLTDTGDIALPTQEQLAAEEREKQEERLKKAQAVHNSFMAQEASKPEIAEEPAPAVAEPVPAEIPAPAPEPVQEAAPAEPVPAEPVPEPVPETPAPVAAEPAPAAEKPAPAPEKAPEKERIASASFDDLMSFLNSEQQKLKQ